MPWLCGVRQLEAALSSTFVTFADLFFFYKILCDVLANRFSRDYMDAHLSLFFHIACFITCWLS